MSLAAFIADQRTSHDVPWAVSCRALGCRSRGSTSGTTVPPHRPSNVAPSSMPR